MNDLIWYASFGSNLLKDRFYCYVQGGVPDGSVKNHSGCRDKRLPVQEKNIIITRELYFAKQRSSWGSGGVAFLKPDEDREKPTFGKMYLITKEQFVDIIRQENDLEGELSIDFEKIIRNKKEQLFVDTWYDQIVFLGYDGIWPVFTFSHHQFLQHEINPAHPNYMACLTAGLRESYGLSDEEIHRYFKDRGGYEQK